MVLLLQSVNRNMKILNATLSSLTEDMTSIETMLITRELLLQDLSGQTSRIDAHEEKWAGSKNYLRGLYQKFAQTSLTYTQ
jgi:hypothetical protein